jgi:hypothetical protein
MTGIVLAHGKAQEVFDINLKTWANWFNRIIVVCPEDDLIQGANLEVYGVGLSEHHGEWNCERCRFAFELGSSLSTNERDIVCVLEYDTQLFGNPPKVCADVMLTIGPMTDNRKEFLSAWYAHSPWCVTVKDAGRIATYHRTYGNSNYCDRWLAAVCDNLKITPRKIENSYSPDTGTINFRHLFDKAIYAASHGATAIHGCKKPKECLCLIKRANSNF